MTCSQKIHNMLAGLEGSDEDSTYVLFLDDDVRLHRNTVGSLVSSMEANQPKMFLTNGFPFDLPPKHGVNFPSYMTMAFHMVLLIAFSHPGEWTKNVWGGCMMVRRSSFVNDEHGCRSKYERGGYSDDLILAALCDEFRRTVGAPADCIFPQRVKHTWRQWWNYMRRQLFVMDTYSTTHNKRVNHGMLLVLSYLSLAVTSGVALCVHDLGVWAYEVATESGGGTPGWEVTEWTLPRTLSVCAFFAFAGALGGLSALGRGVAGGVRSGEWQGEGAPNATAGIGDGAPSLGGPIHRWWERLPRRRGPKKKGGDPGKRERWNQLREERNQELGRTRPARRTPRQGCCHQQRRRSCRRHNQLEPGIPGGACPVRENCPLERRRKGSQEALGAWARDIVVLEEPL